MSELCAAVSEVKPFAWNDPLRCLLVGPHLGYRHYAAIPFDPLRFWTWEDKHPEFPCSSVDCPGDGRYAPPGRGHYDGCTSGIPRLQSCPMCGWTGGCDPRSVACHIQEPTP